MRNACRQRCSHTKATSNGKSPRPTQAQSSHAVASSAMTANAKHGVVERTVSPKRDSATHTHVAVQTKQNSIGYNKVMAIKSFCACAGPKARQPRAKWAPCQKNIVYLKSVTKCLQCSGFRKICGLKPECTSASVLTMAKDAWTIHKLQPMTRNESIWWCLTPMYLWTTWMPAGFTNHENSRTNDVGTRKKITMPWTMRLSRPLGPRISATYHVGKKPVQICNHCVMDRNSTNLALRLMRPTGLNTIISWHNSVW
mmetsp:Transcript_38832/g.117294  ORF Transcript_38832/g.117294 Transcript_38832/m.117294 type:complete len:255 (-) Transcript_38832:347-1111(-)